MKSWKKVSEQHLKVYHNTLMCLKALLHDAIFLATCNAIPLLGDVKLASASLHYTFLMNSLQIKQSSLINIS